MRGRVREISHFLQQCVCELLGRGREQTVRNSDLRQHSFASTPEPRQDRKKRLSLKKLKNRIQHKRKVKSDRYDPQPHRKGFRSRLVPAGITVLVPAVFFLSGGPTRIGEMFSDISLFKVNTLDFVGCESTSEDRLRLLTGINLYHTSLLGLDKRAVAAGVERDPWVNRANVKRDWPAGIVIEVVEHRPIAMINSITANEPQLMYVDRTGVAFLEVTAGHDVDYPVITGLDRFTGEEERKEIFGDIYTFLRLAGRNNPNLPAQSISEIHVNERGEMVVYLVDHTFPIFFGKGQIATKYTRLVKVLDVLYREKRKGMLISGVEYIRMDYLNDKVLVAQSESG